MIRTARNCLLIAAMSLICTPVGASEEDFAFIDQMPSPDGVKVSTITREEPAKGFVISQTIFRQDMPDVIIDTYVMRAQCKSDDDTLVDQEPYIVAVKYKPLKPKVFAVATLHDIYKQVYVRDRDNRIRAYDDLNGREMVDLTETFKPECPKV